MATSGLYEQKVVDKLFEGNDISLGFSWSRKSYSISNNTSTIDYQIYVKLGSNIRTLNFNNTPITVIIDGVQRSYVFNQTVTNSGEWKPVIVSDSITFTHNASGKKSFSFYVIVDDGNLDWTLSSSGTLDDLPRPAVINTAPNFNEEENPTITYSSVAEIVGTVAAAISFTGAVDDIAYREISSTDSSYTFELTDEERLVLKQAVKSGTSTTVRFYIRNTINGEHYWSYLTRTFTLVDYMPTLSPTVRDVDTTIVALTGDNQTIVLDHSNVYYEIGAAATSGTSITNKSAKCGAQVSLSNNGTFMNVDTNVFEFTATDGRGNVALKTIEMNVVPYIKVTCNQTVRLNMDGTIALIVQGNYYDDSFGAQNNSLTIEARSRESGGEWNDWGDISVLLREASGGTYTLTATMSGFDPSGTYEFQARATDKLTSAESTIDSVTLKPIFDWGKYDFNFNVPLTIEGYPLDDYVVETGIEAMGTNGTWYWSKWKSGRAECYGCRNYGNMAVTTAWGGLYRSGAFTQSFPSGLFNATPEVIDITFRGGSNVGGWIASHENSAPSDSETGSFILVRPASATMTQVYISFNVIGRWK